MTIWRKAVSLKSFGDGAVIGRDVGGVEVALYRLDGGYYATADRCPHQWAFLSQGWLEDGHIVCPLHRAAFDVRTGLPQPGTCGKSLATYPVRLEGDDLFVAIEPQD